MTRMTSRGTFRGSPNIALRNCTKNVSWPAKLMLAYNQITPSVYNNGFRSRMVGSYFQHSIAKVLVSDPEI